MSKDQIIEQQRAKIAVLEYRLQQMERMIFGSKRERFVPTVQDADQLNLFEDIVDEPVETPKEQITYQRKKAKAHPGRHPLPEHLPVEETTIEPDDIEEGMVQIGQEVSETIDYTPASLVKKRVIRPKYAHPESEQIIIADLPQRSMPKCIAEPGLVAHLINRKFVEHMPFYRQIAQIKRDYQWEIPSSTMGNWFSQACDLLTPLYTTLRKQLLQASYLQADESPIKVLDSDKPNSTHQGYQWVYHSPEQRLVLFDYRRGRGKAGPKEILRDYRGIIQCDGWQVYDKIAKSHPGITLAGCLAHARRKFYEARDSDSSRAHHALGIIKEIYKHERSAKVSTDRKTYRDQHIGPLLVALKEWADEQALVVLPKSPIGKAIGYYVKQYHKLEAILLDGRVELDNNLIENKIRPLALGRKNYLFAGSHEGARRIAMMYSFFASCTANDVNPYEWLKSTIEKIAETKLSELCILLPSHTRV